MVINPQTLRGIYVAFNTIFNKALTEVQPMYTEIASVIPSTTDSETYAWLGDIPGMREWIGDREVQNLTASDYTIKNKDFELTVGVDRNAIEDDKLGIYNVRIEMLAQSAATHPDELIFKLLADGEVLRRPAVLLRRPQNRREDRLQHEPRQAEYGRLYCGPHRNHVPHQQQGPGPEPCPG